MNKERTLAEATALLNFASREELTDRAFGDAEVYWYKDDEMIASGYFGRSAEVEAAGSTFRGDDAWALRYCGTLTLHERNE